MGVAKFEVDATLLGQLFHFPETAQIIAVKETDVEPSGAVRTLTVYVNSPEFDGLGDGMNPVLITPQYSTTQIPTMVSWGLPQTERKWESSKIGYGQ